MAAAQIIAVQNGVSFGRGVPRHVKRFVQPPAQLPRTILPQQAEILILRNRNGPPVAAAAAACAAFALEFPVKIGDEKPSLPFVQLLRASHKSPLAFRIIYII
jgi:hypothetical protein